MNHICKEFGFKEPDPKNVELFSQKLIKKEELTWYEAKEYARQIIFDIVKHVKICECKKT